MQLGGKSFKADENLEYWGYQMQMEEIVDLCSQLGAADGNTGCVLTENLVRGGV